MKTLVQRALGAALIAGAIAAPQFSTTASAQVNGIATVESSLAVAQSTALGNAYQQIAGQYATQRQTIGERQQQVNQLARSFDTNGDGNLDQTELAATQDANNATVRQIQQLEQEIATLQQPINLARVYVVEQVLQQYPAVVQQVVASRNIQFLLDPAAIQFAAEGHDVTQFVVQSLNSTVTAVNIIPPQGYQPSEQAVNMFQQVQQILAFVAQQQAAANAQQQQQAPAASGR